MNKVYRVLAVAFTLSAFLPFASAQKTVNKGGEWQSKGDSFMYRKSISEPTTEGIYTITLESFTKGVTKMEAAPTDVVLVLDMSGSMRYDMGRDGGTSDARKKAMQAGVKAFIESIDDNDRYLPDDGDPATPRVKRPQRLGNKIGIITFNGSTATSVQVPLLLGNAALDTDNITGKTTLISKIDGLPTPNNGTPADKGMEMAYDWVKVGSQYMNEDRKLRTVVLFTDGAPGSGNYWTDTGDNGKKTWDTANRVIDLANNIRNIGTEANKIKSSVYTVSIIASTSMTDYVKVYLGKSSSNWKDATTMGTRTGWNSSNIWANGNGTQVAGFAPTTDNPDPKNYAFQTVDAAELSKIFEKIAAESAGNAELNSATVSQVDVVSASFALPDGATKDNIEVFTARYLGDDATGMATFGPEIKAPGNTDKYTKITKTIGSDGKEVETIEHNVDVDDSIDWDIDNSEGDTSADAKKDRIHVTGFDYVNLWCGPDESVMDGEYAGLHQGYKLIVKIPIKMDHSAVGGPTLNTNGPGSGFIVNGELWAEFTPPKVSLPVNVHIQKEGLSIGESAKFTIYRRVAGTQDPWEYMTSVFVTRTSEEETTPIVKVVGMPATDDSTPAKPYVYQVVEDDWNWAYKLTAIKDAKGNTIGNLSTRSATTDELETNPFIFVNTKKTNIDGRVKNAESKAMNIFLPDHTEGEYIDSKQR